MNKQNRINVVGLNSVHHFCSRHSTPECAFTLIYDPLTYTLDVCLKADRLPLFTQNAVEDFNRFLRDLSAQLSAGAEILFVVYRSPHKNAFSYGGDLKMLAPLIGQKSEAMKLYGKSCVEMVSRNWQLTEQHNITTVALITGDALGGGFECALSCDTIIAAPEAYIGFPEIGVGLFPGMGSVPFVVRRAGLKTSRKLLTSGKAIKASEGYENGLIDELATPVSDTETAHEAVDRVFDAWRTHSLKTFSAQLARIRAERLAAPVTAEDIAKNVELMLDSVAGADPAFAARMNTIASMQARRFRGSPPSPSGV